MSDEEYNRLERAEKAEARVRELEAALRQTVKIVCGEPRGTVDRLEAFVERTLAPPSACGAPHPSIGGDQNAYACALPAGHAGDHDQVRPRPSEAPPDELTEDERKNVEMHHTLALIHGFNEMATKAITLGEKTYYRLARDSCEKRFNELGGQIDRGVEHAPILVIPGHVPEIRFDERDIGLMRECIARHDREVQRPNESVQTKTVSVVGPTGKVSDLTYTPQGPDKASTLDARAEQDKRPCADYPELDVDFWKRQCDEREQIGYIRGCTETSAKLAREALASRTETARPDLDAFEHKCVMVRGMDRSEVRPILDELRVLRERSESFDAGFAIGINEDYDHAAELLALRALREVCITVLDEEHLLGRNIGAMLERAVKASAMPTGSETPMIYACAHCGARGPDLNSIQHDRHCQPRGRWFVQLPAPKRSKT